MPLPTYDDVLAAAAEDPQLFTLDNGMQVVVIPDHRAPVVTHMVWYKVGASDEERGQSGIAHFLESFERRNIEKLVLHHFIRILRIMNE